MASNDRAASPELRPRDLLGKTLEQIDRIVREAGLVPKGPDPMNGKGAYPDPVTGEQRVLIHPDDGEFHVNDSQGRRVDINGDLVDPRSPAAHLPLNRWE